MLKPLAQIIATFLAIGATFLAAYLIYLYSSRANIDEKIQIEGSEIATNLRSAPTYKNLFSSSVLGDSLIKKYQTKYPNESRLHIFEKIASDLVGAGVFNKEDSLNMLSAAEFGRVKDYIIGRVYFWLVETSMDYLVPEEVYWPGRGHVKRLNYPPATSQTELFPFGPLGVEQWTSDFQVILNYLDFLHTHKEFFLNDIEQFIEKSDDDLKNLYSKFDYKNWLLGMEKVLITIETHNYRVQSLLRLKKSYSIKERLPNLKWIIVLGIGCFILGIAIPLVFLAFNFEHIPTTINLVIGIAAFAFLIGGVFMLGKDVMSAQKSEVYIKYFMPLKKQLIKYNTRNQLIVFDVAIVNQIIKLYENNEIELSKELKKLLKQYRDTVNKSNTCSEQIAEILAKEIKQSEMLRTYVAEPLSGGQTVDILSPLWADLRKSFFEKLHESSDNFIVQQNYERMTIDVFKIKSPPTKEQKSEIEREINRIYDKYSALPDFQFCTSKRNTLDTLRNKLIEKIKD